MKKILIAGGSHSDIPLIKAAQELGYFVTTTGNKPEDLGHQYSNQYVMADFSDRDAMLSLANDLKIDAICSSSNDFSIISSAYVAEVLSLPGFDDYLTTLRLHHKDLFRGLALAIGLKRTKSLSFDFAKGDLIKIKGMQFPLIVKPVDLTGGKGISKVNDPHQLAKAIDDALAISRLGRIVVEEFFEGTLHSYSTFIQHGKVVFEYADNEFSFLNPYLVSTSTSPAFVSDAVLKNMRTETEKLANALSLVNGILHAQFLTNGDEYRIIEYTRRMPGDFYSIPVKMSTGFDQANAVINQCINKPLNLLGDWRQKRFVSRHCSMASMNGTFSDMIISGDIDKKIVDRFELKKIGDKINNYLIDKTAIYFLEYESADEMQRFNKGINQLIEVKIN
ncbi:MULTISPECIES: ATP-grasp domain-containing protein [Polynucleobacter]|uniref:ATP-grasp domain-containing protein n=1 Tax=Polynucleobacter TaxID=44013 RepID=UPI0009ED549E|nr:MULTISPECIES: ATP-grasp domain-containing protein [Polynucleobacter]MBU3553735.1 ATP-grasp domain-containing protein [Polynucleobacter sp. MWH-Post4-6-1]